MELVLVGTGSHFLLTKDNRAKMNKRNDVKTVNVETISIDEFIGKEGLERVDFIKMDIEGSEEKALLGAKETLREFKPKLAVCVYHKPDDFYKLSLLIRKLNPEYRIKVMKKKGTLMAYAV